MKTLYVAWQIEASQEWVPVAQLTQNNGMFELRYTQGARRVPGFTGLGRMNERDQVYRSKELFPFFANRIISKSRPEFHDYQRWLGLESEPLDNPMAVLEVTGGLRATDSCELIPVPVYKNSRITVDFFARGLRYQNLPSNLLQKCKEGEKIYPESEPNNQADSNAIALRSEHSGLMLGYLPRYFSKAVKQELLRKADDVQITLRRVNVDAPLDMRLLLRLTVHHPSNPLLFTSGADFQTLAAAPVALEVAA